MKRAKYERKLESLHVELSHLQEWVKKTGARIVVIFEGRDAAGKGGIIKALTERVSPGYFGPSRSRPRTNARKRRSMPSDISLNVISN